MPKPSEVRDLERLRDDVSNMMFIHVHAQILLRQEETLQRFELLTMAEDMLLEAHDDLRIAEFRAGLHGPPEHYPPIRR